MTQHCAACGAFRVDGHCPGCRQAARDALDAIDRRGEVTRYKLPEALGGGECRIIEKDPALTLMGKPAHVVATVVDVDEAPTYLVVQRGDLTEIKPPLPEEPPFGALVATGTDDNPLPVWRRWMDTGWGRTDQVGGKDYSWDEVCADAMKRAGRYPTRLVPDPLDEPVELPFEWPKSTPYVYIATDGGTGHVGLTVGPTEETSDGYDLLASEARDMARALWAAADQAKRAS